MPDPILWSELSDMEKCVVVARKVMGRTFDKIFVDHNHCPDYLHDPTAWWSVVEKLPYKISMEWHDPEWQATTNSGSPKYHEVYGYTELPGEAVCIAALLGLGFKVETKKGESSRA